MTIKMMSEGELRQAAREAGRLAQSLKEGMGMMNASTGIPLDRDWETMTPDSFGLSFGVFNEKARQGLLYKYALERIKSNETDEEIQFRCPRCKSMEDLSIIELRVYATSIPLGQDGFSIFDANNADTDEEKAACGNCRFEGSLGEFLASEDYLYEVNETPYDND